MNVTHAERKLIDIEGIGLLAEQADVPDANIPFLFKRAIPALIDGDGGATAMPQIRRRAEIFATARNILAQGGCTDITVRHLAKESKLSVQTIYNLIGSREKVIHAAVGEHVAMMMTYATSAKSYPNPFLAMQDTYWKCAVRSPNYMRNSVFAYFPPTRFLVDVVRRHSEYLKCLLVEQRALGRLRDGADVEMLSEHLNLLTVNIMLDWAEGWCTPLRLREELALACGSLLLGSVPPSEARKIEVWMETIRTTAKDPEKDAAAGTQKRRRKQAGVSERTPMSQPAD